MFISVNKKKKKKKLTREPEARHILVKFDVDTLFIQHVCKYRSFRLAVCQLLCVLALAIVHTVCWGGGGGITLCLNHFKWTNHQPETFDVRWTIFNG